MSACWVPDRGSSLFVGEPGGRRYSLKRFTCGQHAMLAGSASTCGQGQPVALRPLRGPTGGQFAPAAERLLKERILGSVFQSAFRTWKDPGIRDRENCR